MTSKFFKAADFSDFEEELNKEEIAEEFKSSFVKPDKYKIKEIRERLELEFEKIELGVSKLTKKKLRDQNLPTTNFMQVVFADFSEKNVKELISLIKQDYGQNVAVWAADVVVPYCPEINKVIYPELDNEEK